MHDDLPLSNYVFLTFSEHQVYHAKYLELESHFGNPPAHNTLLGSKDSDDCLQPKLFQLFNHVGYLTLIDINANPKM